MSNKPRFPFGGGSNRGDDDDDDDRGRSPSSGSRPGTPNRGASSNRPDDRSRDAKSGGSKPGSSAFGSRSPFNRNEDNDDEDVDEEFDEKPSRGVVNRASGSGAGSKSPFSRASANDDDEDEDFDEEDEDDAPPPRTAFGNRSSSSSSSSGSKPSGSGSAFGAKPGSSGNTGFGNKPNTPAKPGGSAFGAKPGSGSGSSFGSKSNEPAKPGGSAFGAKPSSGSGSGSSFGSKTNEPAKPSGSAFGAKPGSSSSSAFGSKTNEPAKPGSAFGAKPGSGSGSSFGSKPNEPAKPGGSAFGAKPGSGSTTASKPGAIPAKPGSPFGGSKTADKKDDKPAGGGLFGSRSPFGGNKAADKKDDRKDSKTSGASTSTTGSRLPFGSSSGAKPGDKPGVSKPADKPASGGLFGRGLPFGKKADDKPTDKTSTQTMRGATDVRKPGAPTSSSAFGARPGAVSVPPKAGSAADAKKVGSKPPARGEKVAKPLERGNKQVRVQSGLSLDQKLDLVGYALMITGVLIFFAIVNPSEGSITATLANLLSGLFGRWGLVAMLVPCFGIGLWLFVRHFNENPLVIKMHRVVGYVLLFLTFITTVHFVEMLGHPVPNMPALVKMSDAVAKAHFGGGWVGGELYKFLIKIAGEIGVPVLLVFFWVVTVMLAFSVTLAEITAYIKSIAQWFARVRRSYVDHRQASAQAKAVAAPQSNLSLGAAATAGATPASATLGAGSNGPGSKKGLPERAGAASATGAPRLAPAVASAGSPATSTSTAPAVAATPFGKAPAKPVEDAVVEDDELDKEAAPTPRPAPAPIGVRPGAATSTASTPASASPAGTAAPAQQSKPNPFGAKPGGASATPAPASGAVKDKDIDDELDEDELDDEPPVKAATAATPADAKAPGTSSPFGPKPGDADKKDNGAPAQSTVSASATSTPTPPPTNPAYSGSQPAPKKPATPIGNQAVPAGAKPNAMPTPAPKPGGSPFGKKPVDDDLDDDFDEDDASPAKSAGAATPVGNRPNPFASRPGGSPFGAKPAKDDLDDLDDDLDEDDAAPAKPATAATPIGNRPAPSGAAPIMARPAPKPGLATTPQFEEDEDEDDVPTYVAVDDADDAPPSNGPRPTVAGSVDTAPASMPRPASPIMPRPRPGDDPSKPPAPVQSGPAAASPFGARPAAVGTPALAANAANRPATPSAPVINHPAPLGSSGPTPTHEGIIVRSKGGQSGDAPDFHDLLESGSQQKINDEVLQERARVIEETLASFSAPGNVIEINPGPVITQFGVEPGYLNTRQGKQIKVKVGQIAKLDSDLALALAARSIRIEAPVPGKSYVGIEVPNAETSLVSLRDIMDSEEFRRINSKLRIGLGQSVDGAPIAADLTQMPHLLIAGTTGSGKSVCVNAIIACLLLQNTPDDLKFIMVDPKRVELTNYNGIPHLVSPVVVDLERIVGVLKWVTREMDERYKKFSQAGRRNLTDYNEKLGPNEPRLPYLVLVIDELADLMMLAPDETEKVLTRLAQMARATGIHLIVSTQRPSVDVVTGLIKANFPARISFAVASSVDSRVILDSPGAEKLLGRGDMLFQAPDAAAPLRMQGVYVSDAEINRITRYWKTGPAADAAAKPAGAPASALSSPVDFNRPADPVQSRSERFNAPTSGAQGGGIPSGAQGQRVFGSPSATPAATGQGNGDSGEDDEMYEEAVDLVKRAGKPSIQMLQRRLRIGYTRAARLIELMEKRGAISSADARNATAASADVDEGDDSTDKP